MLTSTLSAIALVLAPCVAAGASEQFHARHGMPAVQEFRHRRHHTRSLQAANKQRKRATSSGGRRKCKAKATNTSSDFAAPSASSTSTSKSTGSSSSGGSHCPSNSVVYNGVCIGMLPDGGSDGGPQNTMSQLNALVKPKTNSQLAYFGQYSQITSNSWDGGQLKQVMDDLKESGAIFQPAVMPTAGFGIFTAEDNSGAKQICNVMKEFTDEGIEVWLRFAHECNWYLTDGTYQGNLNDCKVAFQEVSKACKAIAPDVKMFWTPNSADMSVYSQIWPGSEHVDYLGIDFYPKQGSNLDTAFTTAMKPLHDEYTSSNGPYFAVGETGLAYQGSAAEKVQYMKSMLTAATDMPQFKATSWFNYIKNSEAGNFKIIDPDDSAITEAFLDLVASST